MKVMEFFMEFVTLEQIAELEKAANSGCLYSLAQLQELGEVEEHLPSPKGLEMPSTYHPNGYPREWGDYGDDD